MSVTTTPNLQHKYQIAYCELYNPFLCGFTADSSRDIHYHYMVIHSISSRKLTHMLNKPYSVLDKYANMRYSYLSPVVSAYANVNIKNYISIATNLSQYYPQIVQKVRLPGKEDVAIIKTMWLRLVQRTWKRVFRERQRILKKRASGKELLVRERSGKWSVSASTLPGLQGMLQGYK